MRVCNVCVACGTLQDFWSTEQERVYLVGVMVKSEQRSKYAYNVHESLEELGRLADTAGLKVCVDAACAALGGGRE